MIRPPETVSRRSHPVRDLVWNLSIRTKTFAVLAVLLSCFAVLGANSYLTMTTIAVRLAAVRSDALPKQTVAKEVSDDIFATHMKVFRYVTLALASNGLSQKLLDAMHSEISRNSTAKGPD